MIGQFFSEDVYNLVVGKISSKEFLKAWGEVNYDAMTGIINVGRNTIITNMD